MNMMPYIVSKITMACAVCFGSADSPMTIGLNYGILSLLAIILSVLGLLGAFFLNVKHKAKNLISD